MIKLDGLQKYFNRNKSNEIHVINDISLTLPDRGLVVLLGPSGSGKTTLLNVLGGLDKVRSGTITFDDEEIKSYNSKTWDKIRNQKVGYIFQNYNLLTNLTVYDNIALTLNMIGIYEKAEIDKRIDYILGSMGMINYRKRRASQLSGGQQQRVAIARALAKNPQVIIADEPTGNLDSKNTQDIMNIIKRISLNKLVVLVTHEEEIANFYGDRIIRLRDGEVVNDDENSSNGTLDVKHETDIYLGDLNQVFAESDDNNNFKVYSDEEVQDELDVRLIVKNKTIYIDLKSDKYQKIQLLEKDTEIKIYDKKYEKISKDDFTHEEFNLDEIISDNANYTKHSVFSFKDSAKLAFNRISKSTIGGKIFYLAFSVIAILIALSVGMLSGIFTHNPDEFLTSPEEIVTFQKSNMIDTDLDTILEHDSVNYMQLIGRIGLKIVLPKVYQTGKTTQTLNDNVVYKEYYREKDIIHGRGIENVNEIIINKEIADRLLKDSSYLMLGVATYDDLLELDYTHEFVSQNGQSIYNIKLVGIIDNDNPVIYADRDLVYFISTGFGIYEMFKDDITLEQGTVIQNNAQFLTYDSEFLQLPLEDNVAEIIGADLTVVGTYSSEIDVPRAILTRSQFEELYIDNSYGFDFATISLHSNDIDSTISMLEDLNIEGKSVYQEQYRQYANERIVDATASIIFSLITLIATAIMYFLVIRSNLLSRIYEISVYRALGVSKGDIRKMFITEIVIISALTSIVGYLAMTAILYRIQILSADYMDLIYISPLSIIGGIVLIFTVNIVSGLIPVSNLISKTPAEILSKYDF